ncbi:MAG: hypothetical protein PWR21_392 [Methanoculleus sp.]|nr:hypothetical protein [Methanoculleus sp.]
MISIPFLSMILSVSPLVYPFAVVLIAILIAQLIGNYQKVGLWGKFQIWTATLIVIVILQLILAIIPLTQDPEKTIEVYTVFSLIFALFAIAGSTVKDTNSDQKHINMDSKVMDLQKYVCQANRDAQSTLRQVVFMKKTLVELKQEHIRQAKLIDKVLNELNQQNQSQQDKNPASGISQSNNGDDDPAISTN